MPETGEVVGRRQPTRPGTDDQDPLAAARGWRRERPPPLQGQIAQETLDGVDRNRAVELGAIAHGLTGVVTDPAMDRRERIVDDERPPSLLVTAGLDVLQPGLDVLPSGTARVAGR